jgi:DNA polymerase
MNESESDPRAELAALVGGLRSVLERSVVRGRARTPRSAPAPREAVPGPLAPASAAAPDLRSAATPAQGSAQEARPERASAAPAEAVEESRARARACADLASLRAVVASCTACPLHATRTQTVFADGTGKARVLFVGEAPGQHEDEQGIPFVGRAGALLTDIVTKGMGLDRREVYIANVLKCRPPGNRDPLPEEKELCTPFLDRQIELVNPEVVITLGLHAAHHVLRTQSSMGKLRGVVHRVGGRKVVATYHPAFLLRTPEMKKECWKDIQIAMGELGLERPSARAPAPEGPARLGNG